MASSSPGLPQLSRQDLPQEIHVEKAVVGIDSASKFHGQYRIILTYDHAEIKEIARRFNDFHALHSAIRHMPPHLKPAANLIPTLPGKTFAGSSIHPGVLAARLVQLGEFVQKVLEVAHANPALADVLTLWLGPTQAGKLADASQFQAEVLAMLDQRWSHVDPTETASPTPQSRPPGRVASLAARFGSLRGFGLRRSRPKASSSAVGFSPGSDSIASPATAPCFSDDDSGSEEQVSPTGSEPWAAHSRVHVHADQLPRSSRSKAPRTPTPSPLASPGCVTTAGTPNSSTVFRERLASTPRAPPPEALRHASMPTFVPSDLQRAGWLHKRGGWQGGRTSWKLRWFIVRDGQLLYFKRTKLSGAAKLLGTMNLFSERTQLSAPVGSPDTSRRGSIVLRASPSPARAPRVVLVPAQVAAVEDAELADEARKSAKLKGTPYLLLVRSDDRALYLSAASGIERQQWIATLTAAAAVTAKRAMVAADAAAPAPATPQQLLNKTGTGLTGDAAIRRSSVAATPPTHPPDAAMEEPTPAHVQLRRHTLSQRAGRLKTVRDVVAAAPGGVESPTTHDSMSADGPLVSAASAERASPEQLVRPTASEVLSSPDQGADFLARRGFLSSPMSSGPGAPARDAWRWEVALDEVQVLGNCLGEGKSGIVYHGSMAGTDVAVKLLHQSDSPAALAELTEEARLLATLRHPNIVLFLGAATVPPKPMIVTEWCDGGALNSALEEHTLPISSWTRLKFMSQAAAGMAYLHMNAMVHQDLKPANCLLTSGARLKVADFGLSQALHHVTAQEGGQFKGTPQYAPPEVLDGGAGSKALDVYAWGVMSTEILSRRMPFVDRYAKFDFIPAVIDDGVVPTLPLWAGSSSFGEHIAYDAGSVPTLWPLPPAAPAAPVSTGLPDILDTPATATPSGEASGEASGSRSESMATPSQASSATPVSVTPMHRPRGDSTAHPAEQAVKLFSGERDGRGTQAAFASARSLLRAGGRTESSPAVPSQVSYDSPLRAHSSPGSAAPAWLAVVAQESAWLGALVGQAVGMTKAAQPARVWLSALASAHARLCADLAQGTSEEEHATALYVCAPPAPGGSSEWRVCTGVTSNVLALLVLTCLHRDPSSRPAFHDLVDVLRELQGQRTEELWLQLEVPRLQEEAVYAGAAAARTACREIAYYAHAQLLQNVLLPFQAVPAGLAPAMAVLSEVRHAPAAREAAGQVHLAPLLQHGASSELAHATLVSTAAASSSYLVAPPTIPARAAFAAMPALLHAAIAAARHADHRLRAYLGLPLQDVACVRAWVPACAPDIAQLEGACTTQAALPVAMENMVELVKSWRVAGLDLPSPPASARRARPPRKGGAAARRAADIAWNMWLEVAQDASACVNVIVAALQAVLCVTACCLYGGHAPLARKTLRAPVSVWRLAHAVCTLQRLDELGGGALWAALQDAASARAEAHSEAVETQAIPAAPTLHANAAALPAAIQALLNV